MHPNPITAFVSSATGHQGGPTALHLLSAGVQVHFLARNPSSPAALALQARGARLFPGDFDNIASLKAAISHTHAVFLNVTPTLTDPKLEITRAKSILEAAKSTPTVTTIIYSSVVMTGQHEKCPSHPLAWYWTNKAQIETLVREAGFKYWTILRPAFLMNNYLLPTASSMFPELVTERVFRTAYDPEMKMMVVVDPDDVGRFAAAVVLDPGRFHTREIDLGGEVLTPGEIARELSLVSGRDIKLELMEKGEVERSAVVDPRVWAQLWTNEVGSQVDLEELAKYGIRMTGFARYLEKHRDAVAWTLG
ncbi:hypothetical protein ASPCADRAFT_134160 [Aspergillus carbonarius ITEM 5010]|uniref:NmrA-like domain-containing protein n=1 Tax=Aspergillus carbonarius (strain ITEM 5010) TaxID=602072 RepID=A0A1R3RAV4_ASPC5|nr:hypothetical protein ASPCADRAFT_134160 [Aspergillus carbonarius ITEM 5010]